jgi:hypothetical protein
MSEGWFAECHIFPFKLGVMVNVVMLCAVEHVPCFCRRHGLEAVGTVVRLDFVRDTEPAADIQTVTTKIYPTQRLRHSATAFVADDVLMSVLKKTFWTWRQSKQMYLSLVSIVYYGMIRPLGPCNEIFFTGVMNFTLRFFCVCVCVFCLGLSVPQIIDYDGSEMTAVTPRPH